MRRPRRLAVAGIGAVLAAAGCVPRGATPPAPPVAGTFEGVVRPVLLRRCAPCHEPGGKMYDRLPFDTAQTIVDHREGVLRRLNAEDKAAVERWLTSEMKEAR